jgi:hypothetical protein
MNLNQLTLGFNLWLRPILLLAAGLIANSAGDKLPDSLRSAFQPIVAIGALLLLGLAICSFLWACWKLWQAANGSGELCHACGGPTRLISAGRYSPHYRCMACGSNRNAECW